MFEILLNFLQKKNIDLLGALPLSACRIMRPYLLERANIASGTVFMLAIPYFTRACEEESRNISAYAVSRDYHLFFEELYDELLPYLAERFPRVILPPLPTIPPLVSYTPPLGQGSVSLVRMGCF